MLRPNHRLGNAVLLTPLIDDLGSRFPDAEIEFISTGTAANAVFKRFPQYSAFSLRQPGASA